MYSFNLKLMYGLVNNKKKQMGFIESLFSGLGQGLTFGMSDEAVGALGALYAKTFAPELFQNQSISDLYKDARDQERNANALAKQQNPNVYGAAELAGGFALPVASFGGGLSGALKAGAGYGGLAGYGYSNEKSIPKQAKDIAIGSMLGAGLGAAGYGAVKAAQNPEVQKLAKEFVTDESGSLKIPDLTNYYKTPSKHGDKLENFLSQNKIEFSRDVAGTGSEYFSIYKPDGGEITVRIADHSNQSAMSSKHSHNYQIYPEDGGMGGGSSVEKLINDLSEKYGLSYTPPKKPIKTQITKNDLIGKYGRIGFDKQISEQAAIKRINEDLKYSDSLFKDIYKMDKQTIKKIMGIE